MVGRAYTEKLNLQPGDQFRIHLNGGEIRLIPLNGKGEAVREEE
jgi:hypothetical protein